MENNLSNLKLPDSKSDTKIIAELQCTQIQTVSPEIIKHNALSENQNLGNEEEITSGEKNIMAEVPEITNDIAKTDDLTLFSVQNNLNISNQSSDGYNQKHICSENNKPSNQIEIPNVAIIKQKNIHNINEGTSDANSSETTLNLSNLTNISSNVIESEIYAVNKNEDLAMNIENNIKIVLPEKCNSLGMLALQYSSDSSDDEVAIVENDKNNKYRQDIPEVSSDSSTESESSLDSDIAKRTVELENMLYNADSNEGLEDEDTEETKNKRKLSHIRANGELLLEDLPPIQDLHITVPENECIELGQIKDIVDQLVLVEALPNSLPLNLDTVLFLDSGSRVLGEIFDVLGQVTNPIYCIRFNSNQQIHEKNIKIGEIVYVAPKTDYTKFIILPNLLKIRGSDASWENDIEPPKNVIDYSDDEEEREAKRSQRNRRRNKDNKINDNQQTKMQKMVKPQNEAYEGNQRPQTTIKTRGYRRYPHSNQRQQSTSQFSQPYQQHSLYQQNRMYSQQQAFNFNASGAWHHNFNQPYQGHYPSIYNTSSLPPQQVQLCNLPKQSQLPPVWESGFPFSTQNSKHQSDKI